MPAETTSTTSGVTGVAKAGVALVIGAGDAIGAAICRCFAREGYTVCAARRNVDRLKPLLDEAVQADWDIRGFACDARDEQQIKALFAGVEGDIGALDVVVFNVGANVPMSVLDTDARRFQKIWEMACFGGFLSSREAARYMLPRKRGSIIFSGATASVRGASGFGAFASAKHGLRAWAQSMARELGPKNIHVAHVIIDAAVDTAWIRDNFDEADALAEIDGLVCPDDLANVYLTLHQQPRNAWTFELDVRPWRERW